MKLLLAESGASKTEWRLIDETDTLLAFRAGGINANVQRFPDIAAALKTEVAPRVADMPPGLVYFYGASFARPEFNEPMAALLAETTGATRAVVRHDLLAASRAAAGREPAVVCILGSGSNACLYDGKQITAQRGGHGYLFGDEGSGADLGKRLLKGLLDEELPSEFAAQFQAEFGADPTAYKHYTYAAERPNVRLAALAPFVRGRLSLPEVAALAEAAFGDFLDKTVRRLPGAKDLPVHFVGSVAFHFRETLIQVCAARNIVPGKIIAAPIDNLVRFHQQYGLAPD